MSVILSKRVSAPKDLPPLEASLEWPFHVELVGDVSLPQARRSFGALTRLLRMTEKAFQD